MDPMCLSASIIGIVAVANDVSQMMLKLHERYKVGKDGKSAVMREVLEQCSTLSRCLHSLNYTVTDTSDLGDRTSNESRGPETLNCLFPYCKASFMDDEALSLHVGSHLDMLPSATDDSFELIRNEQISLQKAMGARIENMRQYKNIECSKGESIKRLSEHLHVVLDELKEIAERLGSNSGYTPHGIGNKEGTQVDKWGAFSYASFQPFQRGLVKATERARLKIDSPMRCDLEWSELEKYSHMPSHTHGLGRGARSVADHLSFCRYCERSYGQDFGVLDFSCLILGKILCPPLQWLSLQSLQFDRSSTLDQSILHIFPSIYQLVTTLSRHHAVALSMSLVSTGLTVLALFLPFSHISERCRAPVLICCWMALVASGPLWTYIGGSAASFFLVFMPYAMSVGISIGLLWYWCVRGRDHQTGMKQEELERRAGWSDIADT